MIPPQEIGVNLALFADGTCLYATERKEDSVLRKLHPGLDLMITWCKCWAIYFSHQITSPETTGALNGRNIPFVDSVKYFGVVFYMKITWRLHIKTVTTKAYRTFIKPYSLVKSERLSTHFKLICLKAHIKSLVAYTCPACEFEGEILI
jgi:hypothetical protein